MNVIELRTATDALLLDRDTGRLTALHPLREPGTNLVAGGEGDPAFVLQYIDEEGRYCAVDSRSAEATASSRAPEGEWDVVHLTFTRVGGLDLDVRLSVRAGTDDRLSRWTATVRNGAGLRIVDLQFPFIVVPQIEDMAVVEPFAFGRLIEGAAVDRLPDDAPERWHLAPGNGSTAHYPGTVFAQFLAAYQQGQGVYLACEDDRGHVKLMKAVRRPEGVRLGVAHVGDWPASGTRLLGYDVVLGSFAGDWYDAAELYRGFGLAQWWATPITDRKDIPEWLLDSPVHITLRLQGYLDDGPAPPIEEFIPLGKTVPLLEGISDRVGAPLVAVIMSWERGGPWVYPDCFPPVGGDEHVAQFAALVRERGWHVGSFCNGTRWVTRHLYNGYEGEEYYERHNGAQSVCHKSDGAPWAEGWDGGWRPSYCCCMGAPLTRTIAEDFVRRLIGWGLESIQYFDQNINAATFPCFAEGHEHPPTPGRWMSDAIGELIASFRRIAEDAGEAGVIQSVEMPCNEYCLPLFAQCDVRVSPPGSGAADFIPLYHYLYHECIIMHGMMGYGPEPYHLPIRTAYNGVLGEIPGAVMCGDGTLLNRDTVNWALWEPKIGSNDDALAVIASVTALRRGPGRPFLVYGRMLRPADVRGVRMMEWEHEGKRHAVPAVPHAAWRSPDGRHGVVLANWTTEEQVVSVVDDRLGDAVRVVLGDSVEQRSRAIGSAVEIVVPPLGCALVGATSAPSA